MPVEFVMSVADLRQATKELKANREEYGESDSVDILVLKSAATFRAVGTETEKAVDGKQPGNIRIPLGVMDRIQDAAAKEKRKDIAFLASPGAIKMGTWSVRNPEINVGETTDSRLALPINLSALDMLGVARILTQKEIVQEALRTRVRQAEKIRAEVVASAKAKLDVFGVSEKQLQKLIDENVSQAAEKLRKTLRR